MPTSPADTVDAIARRGVIAILRIDDAGAVRPVVDALLEGGVRVIEITMTVPGAVGAIRALASQLPDDAMLGAGTVLDAQTTTCVIDAGAEFVVSPVFRPEIIDACHRLGAAAIPGCFSPTEILAAWDAGADVVKVFPSTALGPAYFKDLRGPLPHVKLMPTGGVTIENTGAWIAAGAIAVGIGGALVDANAIASRRFDEITARARRVVAAIAAARQGLS